MRPTSIDGAGDGGMILRPRGDSGVPVPGAGSLGMAVLLVSLSVLFVASVVAYLVVRLRAPHWPPLGAPGFPRLLWLSTALLLGCSGTVHAALAAIRVGNQQKLVRWLAVTSLLALFFLGCQIGTWAQFFHGETFYRHLYGFTFYMLTGLHGAHVVGGLIVLAVVDVRAWCGAYSWAHYGGVRNTAIYWHFLDGVWLILFGSLLATT